MKHLRAVNRKAAKVAEITAGATETGPTRPGPVSAATGDVVALADPPQQPQGPWVPLGCSFVFFPGWEVDRSGGTAGLCQPVERDLFDCHIGCFWPAQVPDQLNHAPDWTGKCAAAQKDWRKIDLIFP
jgi:Quinohemoprotein amine dehydrogenase, gamma subunit